MDAARDIGMIEGPLFIVGHARSGTTITLDALAAAGDFRAASVEGHWMYLILEDLRGLLVNGSADVQSLSRSMMLHRVENRSLLLAELAGMIDRFQRKLVGEGGCWVDKTPGLAQLRILPLLMEMFPASRVIFNLRNPFSVVESVRRQWSSAPGVFSLAKRWLDTSSLFRALIEEKIVATRYLVLRHEAIASKPARVSDQLAAFLETPGITDGLAAYFWENSRKQNAPLEANESRDVRIPYPRGLSRWEIAGISWACRAEMELRGYRAKKEGIFCL